MINESLFPAHAGVILVMDSIPGQMGAFPRTRGGDPGIDGFDDSGLHFSPHTRG